MFVHEQLLVPLPCPHSHPLTSALAASPSSAAGFPHAQCFVCGEKGHLSRACPDNPRGLYPNGGSCKMCGSVEHFLKDCPEAVNSKSSKPKFKLEMDGAGLSADAETTFLGRDGDDWEGSDNDKEDEDDEDGDEQDEDGLAAAMPGAKRPAPAASTTGPRKKAAAKRVVVF